MNWFPVEVDGSLTWAGHSTVFDNDYTFDLVSPNHSLLTKNRDVLHVEFDSTETVNDWDNTGAWWDDFHHKTVDSLKDTDKIAAVFGQKSAIVIGMLGIDMEHGPHSELHPVYAMFINLGTEGRGTGVSGGTDHWAFFVRNWGNEGYCGSGDEPLNEYREIGIPLPETKILNYSMWAYPHGDYSGDQCKAETTVSSPDATGLMVFMLPPATAKCGVFGDLFIQRNPVIRGTEESTGGSSRTSPAVSSEEGADIDPRIMARIARLNPAFRLELYKQLSDIMTEPSRNKPIPGIKITAPSSSGISVPLTGKGLKAVPNPAYEEKKAKQVQLIDAFLKAHGVQ
jgi:hypothetical protein